MIVYVLLWLSVLVLWSPSTWAQGQLINGNRVITGTLNAGASTGTPNAYVLTLNPAITAYVADQCFTFRASFTNTGAATLNVNGVGASPLKKYATALQVDLAAGDIASGQPVHVCFNGSAMQLVGAAGASGVAATPDCIAAQTVEVEGSPPVSTSCMTSLTIPSGSTILPDGQVFLPAPPLGAHPVYSTSSSFDGQIALWEGSTGESLSSFTDTGILRSVAGVLGVATPGTHYVLPGVDLNALHQVVSTHLAVPLPVVQGGTGATTAPWCNTGVAPGTYTNATVTVDVRGCVTSASTGVSIGAGTPLGTLGAVQLKGAGTTALAADAAAFSHDTGTHITYMQAFAVGTGPSALQLTDITGRKGTLALLPLTTPRNYTFKDETGDICTTGSVCTGYAAGDGTGKALSGDSATAFFTTGALEVARGGTGAAPGADDQVFVASSTTAGAWQPLPNCLDTVGQHLNYTAATNTWSCGTTSSGGGGDFGFVQLNPNSVKFPATNPATLDNSEVDSKLRFDNVVSQCIYWQFVIPPDYLSTPVFVMVYKMFALTGAFGTSWDVAVMTCPDTADCNTRAYAAVNNVDDATVPATAGFPHTLTVALANNDTMVASKFARLQLCRAVSDAVDNAAGIAEVIGAGLKFTK